MTPRESLASPSSFSLPPSPRDRLRRGALLATALLAALASGCGFVKVNGKTLGASSGDGARPPASQGAGGGDAASPSGPSSGGDASSALSTSGVPDQLCRMANTDESVTIDALQAELERKDLEYAAEALVGALCTKGGELVRERPRFLQMAQRWMDARHLDRRDVVTLYQLARGRAESAQPYSELPGAVGDYGRIRDHEGAPRGSATALWQVASLYRCFKLQAGPFRAEPHSLATLFRCGRHHFEVTEADALIDATAGMNDTTRYRLRAEVARAAEALRLANRALVDRGAKDPRVKELIAQAEAEHAQWERPSPRRAAALALYDQMSTARLAGRPGALDGCAETAARAWSEAVRGAVVPEVSEHPMEREYGEALLRTPEAYLTFQALRICSAASETEETAPRKLHVPSRGSAAEAAQRLLEDAAQGDEREERQTFSVHGDRHRGVIATIRDVEGGVEVRFEKIMKRQQQCQRYRRTNRVTRIDSSGNLVYEEVCTSWANVTVDVSDRPVRFGKAMAQGLRPGMYLVALQGLPVVATRSAKSKQPIFALGAMLR